MAELSITMDDSIPQQAGPGAGADEREAFEIWDQDRFGLDPLLYADIIHGDYVDRPVQYRWETWKAARASLSHLAAPLAVEDSRERCALTDESIDTLLASVGPTQGMRPDSRDLTLAQVRKLVRAAMAAASSGKEN